MSDAESKNETGMLASPANLASPGSAACDAVACAQQSLAVAVVAASAPTDHGPAEPEEDGQEDSPPAAVPLPSPPFSPSQQQQQPPFSPTSDPDAGTFSSTLPTIEQLQASYHLLWEAIHKHFTVPVENAVVAIRYIVGAIKRQWPGNAPNLPELQKQLDELVDAVAAFSQLLREVLHQQVDTRSFTMPLGPAAVSYYAYILPPPTPRMKWSSLPEYVDDLEAQMLKLFDVQAGPEAIEDVPENEEENEEYLRGLKEDFCLAVQAMVISLGQAIAELKFNYHFITKKADTEDEKREGKRVAEDFKVMAEESFLFYLTEWNRGYPHLDVNSI